MERIYLFGIVTSQLYCNEWCNIKRGRFTDTKLQQRDCCEELGLRFNVGQSCLDVKLEQTASDFDGMKYGSITVTDWEGKLQNRNGKTTSSQTQHTFCNSIYTFPHSSISFPYKLYTCTERSGWNRQFLRLSLGRLGRHKFLQNQFELQIHKQWNLAISCEVVPLNYSNPATEKMAPESHWDRSCWMKLLVETQVKLMLKLKY